MSKGRGWRRLREPRVIDDTPVTVKRSVLLGHQANVRRLHNRITHLKAEVQRQAQAVVYLKAKTNHQGSMLWRIRCILDEEKK